MKPEEKGLVVKSTGKEYWIETNEHKIIKCVLRGAFRNQNIKTTNPIAVGDHVIFTIDKDDMGTIIHILPRNNYIYRKSINLSKTIHIIAANIDIAFLVISLIEPRTPLGFIDRFLVAAEAFRIPICILFNKNDLYRQEEKQLEEHLKNIYQPLNYTCLSISALTNNNTANLIHLMEGKISLFCGQSGVGKSSLINCIAPELQLKTGQISTYNQKGKHTTTFAQMFHLPFEGYIVDTPGIKEFGLIAYKKEEVGHYFPEILAVMSNCKFNNCTHTHEPHCAVKQAVENNQIAKSRYNNYLSIINNEDIDRSDWQLK